MIRCAPQTRYIPGNGVAFTNQVDGLSSTHPSAAATPPVKVREAGPDYSREVVSALSGVPRTEILAERNRGSGRGTFDRGDLKEAAGAAGRAMEPLAGFWVLGLAAPVMAERERQGRPALRPLRTSGRAGNGRHDGAMVTWKGFSR